MDKKTKRQKMVDSGSLFERQVASLLNTSLGCKIIFNPRFYSRELGRGMECDLLVLTPSKIYCVECKHYNGFVSGNKFDETWTFVSSGKLGHVQNPYLLNKRHIRLIRGTFHARSLVPLDITSYIVVPDKCNIHVEGCNVVHLSELLGIITFDNKYNKPMFNVDLLERYFNKVKCN